jgi:hypothetical protein
VTLWETYRVGSPGETFRTIATNRLRGTPFSTATYGSYEELLIANLGSRGLFRADSIGGTGLDEDAVARRVVEARMGTLEAGGRSYQLRPGLTVWIPLTVDMEINQTSETPWYAEMMDIQTDEWKRQMDTYRREKAEMSKPAFQYHRVKYLAVADRDRFINEGEQLRDALVKQYKQPPA